MALKKKAEKTQEEKADVAAETAHTESNVYAHSGGLIRIYTRELHGDNFKDLAGQMAAQHPGSRIEHR